jgi:hypothetical protein
VSAPEGIELEQRLDIDAELATILLWFPELVSTSVRVTSRKTSAYNCTAWAAGLTKTRIVPPVWGLGPLPGTFWPESVPPRPTVRAYEEVFETFGYSSCDDGEFVIGTEKIALYAHEPYECLHAARQTVNGMWTSKMGDGADIEHHEPSDVEGEKHGQVVAFLRREFGLPRRLSPPTPALILP